MDDDTQVNDSVTMNGGNTIPPEIKQLQTVMTGVQSTQSYVYNALEEAGVTSAPVVGAVLDAYNASVQLVGRSVGGEDVTKEEIVQAADALVAANIQAKKNFEQAVGPNFNYDKELKSYGSPFVNPHDQWSVATSNDINYEGAVEHGDSVISNGMNGYTTVGAQGSTRDGRTIVVNGLKNSRTSLPPSLSKPMSASERDDLVASNYEATGDLKAKLQVQAAFDSVKSGAGAYWGEGDKVVSSKGREWMESQGYMGVEKTPAYKSAVERDGIMAANNSATRPEPKQGRTNNNSTSRVPGGRGSHQTPGGLNSTSSDAVAARYQGHADASNSTKSNAASTARWNGKIHASDNSVVPHNSSDDASAISKAVLQSASPRSNTATSRVTRPAASAYGPADDATAIKSAIVNNASASKEKAAAKATEDSRDAAMAARAQSAAKVAADKKKAAAIKDATARDSVMAARAQSAAKTAAKKKLAASVPKKQLDAVAAIYASGDSKKIANWERFVANSSSVKKKPAGMSGTADSKERQINSALAGQSSYVKSKVRNAISSGNTSEIGNLVKWFKASEPSPSSYSSKTKGTKAAYAAPTANPRQADAAQYVAPKTQNANPPMFF